LRRRVLSRSRYTGGVVIGCTEQSRYGLMGIRLVDVGGPTALSPSQTDGNVVMQG
jgi:hypothetical protein